MKPRLFFVFLLTIFSASLVSSTHIHKKASHKGSYLGPGQKKLYKVGLTKITPSPEKKSRFLNLLSQTHKILKKKDIENISFLQKSSNPYSDIHELKLGNYRNAQYLGELSVGHPNNSFKVIYDTGSANVWINSEKCPDTGCVSHKRYRSKDFNTYKELGYGLDVEFGTGELIGEINSDNVYFAGVQVDQQIFAEITHEIGDIFEESAFDGIVGLSYPNMAAYRMEPIFDNVMKQGRLDHNVFSFYFDDHEDTKNSRLILGGADPSYYYEPLVFFPVSDKYYWSVRASSILVGGKDIGICKGGCTLVADTGTSLITGPTNELNVLIDSIDIDGLCNRFSDLPDITFVLENGSLNPQDRNQSLEARFVLKPQDYVYQTSDFLGFSSTCTPTIMPLDVPEPHGPLWILGDSFLKKYYSVYDRDNDVIGFAEARPGVIESLIQV